MKPNDSSLKRLHFGLFLIVIGAFLVFVKLGFAGSLKEELISWKMLFIGIGIFSLIGGNKKSGTILIVIGGIFMLPAVIGENFEYMDQLKELTWPLLIVIVGIAILVTHGRKGSVPHNLGHAEQNGMDFFDDFVIFGGREIFVNSQNFFGGKITAMFGGAEYDLRQANLSQNGAVIECTSIFGGCGFKVPPEWSVKNEITTVFGGYSDKRGVSVHQVNFDPEKTLILKGFSAFGGVEVKYH